MTRYTPEYGLPAPEGNDPVLTSDDLWTLARKTETGFTQAVSKASVEAERIAEEKVWLKDVIIPAGASFADYIGVGQGDQIKGRVLSGNAASIGDWPAGLERQGGNFTSVALSSSISLQTFQTHNFNNPQFWIRSASGTGGQPWHRIGAPTTELPVESLPAGQDMHELDVTPGTSKQWVISAVPLDWVAQHLPDNVRGTIHVTATTGTVRYMTFLTIDEQPRLFVKRRYGTQWSGWTQIGGGQQGPVSSDKPASGMKRVGVPITAGHSGSDAPLEGTVRMPLLYGAPITRWRLRIQNINSRSGATRSGPVNISAVWIGHHTGNGAMTDLVNISGSLEVTDAGQEFYTPWSNTPLDPDVEYLLSFGYTASTAPWAMLGHAYVTGNPQDASVSSPTDMSQSGTVPFTISIEAETYTTTPVIAVIGASNECGVGAAHGLHESWPSVLCRRLKALPDHRGSSGDTMLASLDGNGFKWTRFDDLAKPDCLLFATGRNDIAQDGQTLEELSSRLEVNLQNAENVSDNVYLIGTFPRNSNPWDGFEALRQQYNDHLQTLPGQARDYFDVTPALSDDGETIRPEYDHDGQHLTAAGFEALQAAINRPVTTPPVVYQQLS